MRVEVDMPVDDRTGIPHPMLPPPDRILTRTKSGEIDLNHAFHPRMDVLLQGVGGLAVRHCRVQLVPWHDHHNVYHRAYYGPPLPETVHAQFRTVVFAAAGYIPEFAVDCRGNVPVEYVPIDASVRKRLWDSGEIRVDRPGLVRRFIVDYLLGQDLTDISYSIIEEFMETSDANRKRYLGEWLIAQAAERACEPIDTLYRVSHRSGFIMPAHSLKSATFVHRVLGSGLERRPVVQKLGQYLRVVA